jgi:hypothetical protein
MAGCAVIVTRNGRVRGAQRVSAISVDGSWDCAVDGPEEPLLG